MMTVCRQCDSSACTSSAAALIAGACTRGGHENNAMCSGRSVRSTHIHESHDGIATVPACTDRRQRQALPQHSFRLNRGSCQLCA